ncbi:lipoprotein [Vibrio gallicus]|nr:lipoprotein [Vibrio gallicus]
MKIIFAALLTLVLAGCAHTGSDNMSYQDRQDLVKQLHSDGQGRKY